MKERLQAILGLGVGLGLMWLTSEARVRTAPRVWVGGERWGWLKEAEVARRLQARKRDLKIVIKGEGKVWELGETEIGLDEEKSRKKIMAAGRGWGWWKRQEVEPVVRLEEKALMKKIRGEVEERLVRPQIRVVGGKVEVENGEDGVRVKEEELREKIWTMIRELRGGEIELPVERVREKLREEEIKELKSRGESLLGRKLKIAGGEKEFVLEGEELVSLLATEPEGRDWGKGDKERVREYVGGLRASVERRAVEARFQVKEGRVVEFRPDEEGKRLRVEESAARLREAIDRLLEGEEKEIVVELAIETIEPRVKTENVNDLGIVERLGRGESFYRHSIPARAANVELAAKRIDGVLVAPGEEFSFAKAVGEISGATGFKSAYIIKDGKTILGDGGGVCQVSTTAFRAALDAGLPVTERWAHSYRVGYYEQNSKPGFDATVYAPSKDLRFKNDTEAYILVDSWYEPEKQRLVVDLYGKKDGRKRTISQARVWDITPPPPPVYQEDPSLPKGVVKQVDWRAWGAKVAFDYRIEKGGEVVFEKTFFSSYRPWQDVFLVGTGD